MTVKSFVVDGLILALCIAVFGIEWPVYNDSQLLGFVISLGLYSVGSFVLAMIAVLLPALLGLVIAAIAIDDTKIASCIVVVSVVAWAFIVGLIYDIWALTGGLANLFDPFPVFTTWQAVAYSVVTSTIVVFMGLTANKKS